MSLRYHDQHRSPRGRRNRARPDLDLKHISAKLKISQGYLSQILSGRRTPSLSLAARLAPELGIPLERLEKELAWYKRRIRRP
jgi:transcriptional regulator with XRE-family HTH domain